MISLSRKHLAALLLGIALATISSCVGKANHTVANPPVAVQTVSQAPIAQNPNSLRLGLPIDCTLGKDCYIMHYVDRDPGPAEVDFGCGRQTYNGHDGTDFGIPDETAMAKGVAVKAVAPGRVLRVRDGVADRRVADQTTKDQVKGIECGNGMAIDHGNGWEAQYCHLRQGSIAVKPGTSVEKGTVLGMVGQSGLASFPHVHLTLRYQGKPVDPFVGPDAAPGCQVSRQPLWEQSLNYVPTGLIRAGFSTQEPDMNQVLQGRFSETVLSAKSPALIFWVKAYGVLQGDRERYRLLDPKGQQIIDTTNEIKASKRAWLSYVGKKNRETAPLSSGLWRAEYQLTRGDRVLMDVKREVELR